MKPITEIDLEDRIKLEQIKMSVRSTSYFIVDKMNTANPVLLLYSKGGNGNILILKRTNISRFLTEVKRIVGITKESFNLCEKDARAKCELAQVVKTTTPKKITSPKREIDTSKMWWNRD